jgi:MFS family permease
LSVVGRSWRTPFIVLICATGVVVISMGVRMTYGVWMPEASRDLGWGMAELSFAMGFQALMWGVGAPFAGSIADRFGAGRVIVFAGISYTAGLVLMAYASTQGEAILSIGVLTGLAMGASTFPIVLALISRAVEDPKKRAIYLGIASSGGSSGQIVVLPIAHYVMVDYGWITTLFVLAGMTALIVPMAAGLTGRAMSGTGPRSDQKIGHAIREAFGHSGYLLLTAGYFVCGFQTLFIAQHFPKLLESYDVRPDMGAWAISLIGLFNIAGCFFWGAMGGRRRKKFLLVWLYLLRSVVMVAFIMLPITDVSVTVFAALMGFLWLGTVPLTGAVVGDIFGFKYMATLFGFSFLSHQLGSFIGVWAGGWLYDIYGNYDIIWWASIVLGLGAALLNYPIDDRPIIRAEARAGTA